MLSLIFVQIEKCGRHRSVRVRYLTPISISHRAHYSAFHSRWTAHSLRPSPPAAPSRCTRPCTCTCCSANGVVRATFPTFIGLVENSTGSQLVNVVHTTTSGVVGATFPTFIIPIEISTRLQLVNVVDAPCSACTR